MTETKTRCQDRPKNLQMKTKHILLAAVLAATPAIQAASAEHKLPAPLPEFKTPEQLARWRQEMTAKAAAAEALAAKQGNSATSTSAFYTGKPYVEETGSYAFNFRQYDPKLSRWTSADPSGFPNGTNNHRYTTRPTQELDALGLFLSGTFYSTAKYGAGSTILDEAMWSVGKSGLGNLVGISTLGIQAMSVADGSAGATEWVLSSSEAGLAEGETSSASYNNKSNPSDPFNGCGFDAWVDRQIHNAFNGTANGGGNYSLSLNVLYPQHSDGYWAFGNAQIAISGAYSIRDYNFGWISTVSLSDTFSFLPYSALASTALSATGAGYRLQDSGYLQAFTTSGSWQNTWTANLE